MSGRRKVVLVGGKLVEELRSLEVYGETDRGRREGPDKDGGVAGG